MAINMMDAMHGPLRPGEVVYYEPYSDTYKRSIRLDTIYGHQFLNSQTTYNPIPKFPRSDQAKENRMSAHVQWKREKIRERIWIHVGVGAALLFVVPLVITAASYVWRLAIYAVAQ